MCIFQSVRLRRLRHAPRPARPSVAATLTQAKTSTTRHHTVKRGETLYSIANSYKTSVQAIKDTNANVATLRPGMVFDHSSAAVSPARFEHPSCANSLFFQNKLLPWPRPVIIRRRCKFCLFTIFSRDWK